jgi:hypothetical protein
MRIFLIFNMITLLSITSAAYGRANILTADNYCLEYPNSEVCNTLYLKEVKIAQESQVKHLMDISLNLKEIAEQLALIRKQLEGVKK